MMPIEMIAAKIYTVVQPHLPIGGGTFFHLLFLRMRDKESGIKRTFGDILNIALISMTIGVLIQFVIIGYYEFKGLEPKPGVIIAFGVSLAMLGFGGLVWIMNTFKEYSGKALDAGISKISSRKKQKSSSRYGGSTDEHFDEYD